MLLKRTTIIIIIFGLIWGACGNREYKIVNTEYGRVRGCMSKTLLEQRPIVSFTGIPYAKPPVLKLRFEVFTECLTIGKLFILLLFLASTKATPWNVTLDALEYKNVCNQMDAGKPIGNEDCLYINVFTPGNTLNVFSHKILVSIPTFRHDIFEKTTSNIFIHGGGFYSGSGNIYGPELLLDHDVILVTFNYRLGPFGFLSLGNGNYSGNLALKDQLLALKWVRANIRSFGGDEDRITIHGWSAGCWSVSLHMASPASQGLFKRAICFSASALVPWIVSYVKDHKEIATKFAISNDVRTSNDQQLIDYLKSINADKLANLSYTDFYTAGTEEKAIKLPWVPVVESARSKNPFLLESPENYFNKENYGQYSIDTLFGYADAESYSATSAEIQNPLLLAPFNEHFHFQLPLIGLNYSYNDENYPVLANEIRHFYFGNENITTQVPQFSAMMNDLLSYPVHRATKLLCKVSSGRTFYYIFAVDLKLSIFKILSNARAHGLLGKSTHGDDIFYVFKIKNWDEFIAPGTYESLSLDSKEVAVIKTMTAIIANFATEGRPTHQGIPIDWKKVDKEQEDVNYVTITEDGLRAGVNPKAANYAFWDSFFIKYQHRLHGC